MYYGLIGSMQKTTPSLFDADAQAFITAAAITNSTQQSAINTLVLNFKSYGIWTKMKAIYPMVGGTATAHKFNLKDPRDLNAAFRLSFFGGWAHSSTGALPNGSNAVADTFLNPATVINNVNDGHLSYYSRTNNSGTNQIEMGNRDNNSSFNLVIKFGTSTSTAAINMSDTNTFSNTTSSDGFYHANQNNTANVRKMFKNGTTLATQTVAQNLQPSLNVFIGARNFNNVATFYCNRECAFASIGNGLTDIESANFYTAVQAFQTTLGRQIIDEDAQAFITAAAITNSTQQSAINTLVLNFKSYGIWTKMKAIYPMVGGTASSHKFNLKDPRDLNAAFRLSFIGGWIHSATGAKPNGTSGYADTFLAPNTDLTLNGAGISYYAREVKGVFFNKGALMGAGTGTSEISFFADYNDSKDYIANNNAEVTGTQLLGKIGLIHNTRIASTGYKVYNNGVVRYNQVSASVARTTSTIHISRVNGYGDLTDVECSFAAIDTGLTDAEASDFYTAVQSYQTTLGRQVGVTEAQAFITAAGITASTQISAVTQLVTDLKTYGLWSKMKAIYPFVGGTANAHKFNLKDPLDSNASFRLSFIGGWVHSATGAKPNGTNGYADTFLTQIEAGGYSDIHLSYYSRTNNVAAAQMVEMGRGSGLVSNSYTNAYFRLSTGTSTNGGNIGSRAATAASTNSIGHVINTATAASSKGYKNGALFATQTATQLGTAQAINIYIGSQGNHVSATEFSDRECAFSSIGGSLTDTEAANFYTAVQAFQTTLGRQV